MVTVTHLLERAQLVVLSPQRNWLRCQMSAVAVKHRRVVRGPATRYGAAALASEVERNLLLTSRGNRHNTLFSSACRIGELVGGGEISETLAITALVEVGSLVKPEARSEIERTVRDGVDRGRKNNPRTAPTTGVMVKDAQEARMRLLALLHKAGSDPTRWSGMAGASDLRVLVGLLLMGLHAGKLRVGASYRQIAERSGVSLGTVTRALGALEGSWIRRTHFANGHRRADRSVFQLLAPADWIEELAATTEHAGGTSDGKLRQCSLLAVDSSRLGSGLRDPGHPLWKRRSTAWRLWCALAEERDQGEMSVSAKELAAMTTAPERTVWRNLAWLAEHDLVECADQRWSAVGEADAVGLVAHLEPQRELVRERHRIEREQHRVWLAERSCAGRLRKGHVVDDAQIASLRMARTRIAGRWDAHRQQCRLFEAMVFTHTSSRQVSHWTRSGRRTSHGHHTEHAGT
jgi:hypothetical protein